MLPLVAASSATRAVIPPCGRVPSPARLLSRSPVRDSRQAAQGLRLAVRRTRHQATSPAADMVANLQAMSGSVWRYRLGVRYRGKELVTLEHREDSRPLCGHAVHDAETAKEDLAYVVTGELGLAPPSRE